MNEIDVSMFWDIGRTLTHNALFNFIVGNRGGGKSYGAKKRAIDNFIKKKEQFGYIRRYKEDLQNPMEQFFDDVGIEYPDYEFKVEGKKFYIRIRPENPKEKWTKADIAGYGFVLSTANNRKSISYPFITTLIFDEFLLEEGNQRYLPQEPTKLLSLYETIARPGTGHPRVVLFLLANAITITNPYFLYFGLRMPTTEDKNGKWIWKHPTKPLLVEDVKKEDFIAAKQASEFGQLVSGTGYGDYSIENKFLLDDDTFISKKTEKARHWFNFIYKNESFGVWADFNAGQMFVSKSIDPSGINYSFTLKDHSPNTMLFKSVRSSYYLKKFMDCFKGGNLYFETMDIKNMCYEVLKMTMS